MKILKREEGLLLLEQYGKQYVRFAAGGICEILYQVPISADEKDAILEDVYSMSGVVNSCSNKGELDPDVLIDSLINDYLQFNSTYSAQRRSNIIQKLHKYGDILYEFYYYVLHERMENDGIEVEGYNAKQLTEKYPLTVLGAYNYLIYLREDPSNALSDLQKGLPRK